jgi:hypothetical protein
MTGQESLDQPDQTPFTSVVEHLRASSGDREQFDLAVRAALAKVKVYEETLGVGKQITPDQTQMLYEHGFTLLKRELPSDFSLLFARQANTEVMRKDQKTGQNIYEQPLVEAFNTTFAEEIGFDKEAAEILQAQPTEVLPTVDSAAEPDELDRDLAALNGGRLPTAPESDEDVALTDEVTSPTGEAGMSDAEAVEKRNQEISNLANMTHEQLRIRKISEDSLNPGTQFSPEELEEYRVNLIRECAYMDAGEIRLREEFLESLHTSDEENLPVADTSNTGKKSAQEFVEKLKAKDRITAQEALAEAERALDMTRFMYERAKNQAAIRARRDGIVGMAMWKLLKDDMDFQLAKRDLKRANRHVEFMRDLLADPRIN